jgi:hypothetical protein
MPDIRASPEEDVKDAKLVANELCIEEGSRCLRLQPK